MYVLLRIPVATHVEALIVVIQEKVYDSFAEKLAAKLKEMKVGDGARDDVKIGPLIHSDACKKVADIYDDAVSKVTDVKVH